MTPSSHRDISTSERKKTLLFAALHIPLQFLIEFWTCVIPSSGEADTHTASSCSLCLTASSCSLCLTASSCSTATSTDAHTGMTCVPPMTLHRCYVCERARLLQCRVRWCAANLRWGRPGGAWPCVWRYMELRRFLLDCRDLVLVLPLACCLCSNLVKTV